jgi:hypothetical protein
LAGVCAAIAAARLGRTVSLVNNRPVLGGNSSSEVRVWVCGATGHGANHNAREGGIMGEMFVENQFRNPEGNPYYWDLVVLDTVRAEPNITVFLNTDVREVQASGPEDDRRIESVTGWMMGSERSIRYESPLYLDCTGDGLVGFLAGARHRIGREGQDEFGESFAPEVADDVTLGSTLLFYTKDFGKPVKYIPPSFAKDISTTPIPEHRIIRAGDNGCAYWWIEWGGELDTVHDNERIRDELWSVIYGIWDHIKNSGKFDADNMTLEWVGALPGKREYRRFVGGYMLKQHDIMEQTPFDDRVAFGGWSIDLHPPGGMYATEAGSKHRFAKGIYHIPYRSLYSQNVGNLLMAGRDISASHVAFGSTRVMATCGTIGEGAGTAAALCLEHGVSPAGLARDHVSDLRRTLLRQDASMIGVPLIDPGDLAATAEVTASSTLSRIAVETPDDRWPLEADLGVCLPADPAIEGISLLIDATSATELTVELYDPVIGQNYVPERLVDSARVAVPAGDKQWVDVPVAWRPDAPANAFVVVKANADVAVWVNNEPAPGILCFTRVPPPVDIVPQPSREWAPKPLHRRCACLRVAPATAAFAPAKAVDGFQRPYAGPHMWVSEPVGEADETWLQLSWASPVEVGAVELILDDDVNEDLINLHHHRTPFDVMPTLLKDYRIEARVDGQWQPIADQRDNRVRHRRHSLPAPASADAVRLVVESTNGSPSAHVIGIRVYR